MGLLDRLIDLYSLVVIVSVVTSWASLDPRNPVVVFVSSLVEPVLRPLRKVLPAMGSLDFSPMVLLFALQALKGVVPG